MEKGRRDSARKAGVAPPVASTVVEPAEFLNIDLEIRSRTSLGPLLDVWPNADQPERPSSDRPPRWLLVRPVLARTAEAAAKALLRDIERMPEAARRCWKRASSRTFDIGIQAGPPGRSFEEVQLTPGTLARIADAGCVLKVTVYPPYGAKDEVS